MRIIFLGSPNFAVTCLERLIESGHDILCVITQPDKPGNRGKITPPEVKVFAEKKGLTVYQFPKIARDGVDIIKKLKPDIMITAAYGQIISQEIIDIPHFGIINVHASLLPKYRGASPVQSAIIAGEQVTGITIMQTEAGLDTGDILAVRELEIAGTETAGELMDKLAVIGADLLIETLDKIKHDDIKKVHQISEMATITTKIRKEDALITFQKSALQIKNLILGTNPDPISYCYLNGEPLKIYRARVAGEIESEENVVGMVLDCSSAKHGVFVQCGVGVLELLEIQFPGGKVLPAKTLMGGRKINVGDVLQGRIKEE